MYSNVFGEVSSEEKEQKQGEAHEEGVSNEEGEELGKICALLGVARRSLNTQVKEDEHHQQRKNIFYTRCLINQVPCSVIIDSGSCTNVKR
jgi:hypothetical protein